MTQPDEARAREIADLLTPGIRRWLLRLFVEGPTKRSRGNVGYRAMRAHYTEWCDVNGEDFRECLTPLGWLVAAEIARMEARDAPEAP